ncbi:MAG: reverse transcriptase domain-containing protein, partial [Gloeomargaritales cyanobacterium]
VVQRKRDSDGNLIGRKHKLPQLDSRQYTVRWPDGEEGDFSYNIIAEHLYSQVDEKGNQFQIFREIIDRRKTNRAVDKADQYRVIGDKRVRKKTTAGWDLEVEWKDGSASWLPLKQLKETNPVDVAEYAVANRIDDEPAFDWWVRIILKRKTRLIKASISRHRRVGYKFGIRIPETTEEALRFDQEDGTSLWRDAIKKEMAGVKVAFDVLEKGAKPPPGYKRIPLRMVFTVKMDFTRKVRLVAGGHRTDPPKTITYASVVSRESVRIALLLAALYDVEVKVADIGNAYLNAKTTEKVYSIAGPEFGAYEGHTVIIVRALYGLKSAGASWRAHLAATLRDLGFKSSFGDPDVWLRPATKEDGTEYYEYILVYADDLLIVSAK